VFRPLLDSCSSKRLTLLQDVSSLYRLACVSTSFNSCHITYFIESFYVSRSEYEYSDNESYHYSDEDMDDADGGGGGVGVGVGGVGVGGHEDQSDFEFSSDGNEPADDLEVAIENEYYNAKQSRDTSNHEALAAFEDVVSLEQKSLGSGVVDSDDEPTQRKEQSYGQWSYKAIKQLVKLHLLRTNDKNAMLRQYDRLLQCVVSSAVTQNVYEKGIMGVLDRVAQAVSSRSASSTTIDDEGKGGIDRETLRLMYTSTLAVVQPNGACPNERLWFKTSLKLGQLLYEMNDIAQLQVVIKELLKSQQRAQENSGNDSTRYAGTHLLEIYALQIQLYSRKKDNKKLRELFDRAMRVEGGIPHPRTLALVQEMGGKMHMASKEFEAAGKTFFQAFKSYDEAGDPNRLRCLKYLVMASMLHASTINPFDSQEARPYKDDPEIVAMTSLVQAFQNKKIREFEGILRKNEGRIMEDEFIREHLADLLRSIRTQVIQNVIAPCKFFFERSIPSFRNYWKERLK